MSGMEKIGSEASSEDFGNQVAQATRELDLRVARRDAATSRTRRILQMPARTMLSKLLRTLSSLRRRPLKVQADTFWGDRMMIVIPEPVSMNILEFGFLEEELSRMLFVVLRPGDIFFDVGAHFGYYSLLASWLVGEHGKVVAFEPTPSSRTVLQTNASGHPNISIEPVAAWSSSGEAEFADFGVQYSAFNSFFEPRLGDSEAPPAARIRVTHISLDEHVSRTGLTPDVIKIDAESSELEILRGMTRTLAETRPLVSMESGDVGVAGAPSTAECVDLLRSFGYRYMELERGALREAKAQTRSGHQNLLFVPSEKVDAVSAASR